MGADHLTWATAGPKRKMTPIRTAVANANFLSIKALLCSAKLSCYKITCIDGRIQEEKKSVQVHDAVIEVMKLIPQINSIDAAPKIVVT